MLVDLLYLDSDRKTFWSNIWSDFMSLLWEEEGERSKSGSCCCEVQRWALVVDLPQERCKHLRLDFCLRLVAIHVVCLLPETCGMIGLPRNLSPEHGLAEHLPHSVCIPWQGNLALSVNYTVLLRPSSDP